MHPSQTHTMRSVTQSRANTLTRSAAGVVTSTPPCRQRVPAARFMNPQHADHHSHIKQLEKGQAEERLIAPALLLDLFELDTMQQHAKDSLGWLRHAFQDPDDFSASAIGRMVSKEYGAHERSHTEHHMWRSPGSSPRAVVAHQAAAAASSPAQGAAATAAAAPEHQAYQSPPSGPGFMLQQQREQQREQSQD